MGGSRSIAQALASYFRSLGGEDRHWVAGAFSGRAAARSRSFFVTQALMRWRQWRRVCLLNFSWLPSAIVTAPRRSSWIGLCANPFRGAIPPAGALVGVHLGGTLEEIIEEERAPAHGRHAAQPFVLLAQPSLFDVWRAPSGRHTAWAYCHVPHASKIDMTAQIEAQVERFAPGFGDVVLARSVRTPADLERANANLVGGDIAGGMTDLRQILLRPTWRGYRTPVRGLYLCSASTPPGGGVHGLCGYYAAQAALKDFASKGE